MNNAQSLDLLRLRQAFDDGLGAAGVARLVLDRIAASGDDRVWISRVSDAALLANAVALDARRAAGESLPLFGVPFGVKDNIDVAGLPTTAACSAYAYRPERSAPAVQRLIDAGALFVGKTNLDQFATGLVGVRSPYGVARNPFDGDYIPGGSSSGSAVAVAAGQVSFALGTDTAGSGRVPAMFNNIVGLKPTRGLIGTQGVVPACRSLDCISVFALTVDDAMAVLSVAAGETEDDPFSRPAPAGFGPARRAPLEEFRFAIPRSDQLRFFGNPETERLWALTLARLADIGGTPVEIDYAPFLEAALLLYEGPWIAERTAAIDRFLREQPDALLPVTRQIIEGGRKFTAVDAFAGQYKLNALRRATGAVWRDVEFLLLPTAGTIYRTAEVQADPVKLNSNLGYYTNSMNLLDLCGIAVPSGFQNSGLPAGVTLVAPAWHEAVLAGYADRLHRLAGVPLGATRAAMPEATAASNSVQPYVAVAVFGAHMSGQPLNGDVLALGGRYQATVRTRPVYRLYRLRGEGPARPGLVRTSNGDGCAIEAEVWLLPTAAFGAFAAAIPGPLGIGAVDLEDGSTVTGFVCEAAAVDPAEDISRFGGWRGYLAEKSALAPAGG